MPPSAASAPTSRSPKKGLDALLLMWPDMAMKSVKIAELKDHLSEHLRSVERGAEVVVTDRSRPIARIVPVTAAGRLRVIAPPQGDFAAVRDRRRTPADWRISSTELLQEERLERRS